MSFTGLEGKLSFEAFARQLNDPRLRCCKVRRGTELDKSVQTSNSVIRLPAFDSVGSVELLK